MGTSSGSNIHHHTGSKMLLPHQQPRPMGLLRTSLSLVPYDYHLSPEKPRSNCDDIQQQSPTESASSLETWPTSGPIMAKNMANGKPENDFSDHSVTRSLCDPNKISLPDIARERVEIICEKMDRLSEKFLEDLKNRLRSILDGNCSQHREEFFILQKLVQNRTNLTADTLMRANRVQLEILVSINTGILAYLHPSISLSQTNLIEIFHYRRCRNIACQNQLPADDCTCEKCTSRNGFCNLCMCVICNKFDFEVNTCCWIGCDLCSHWTHTDCAIREGQICMGPAEMLFRCQACSRTSELFGWVKDVFQHCALAWNLEALMRELDFISRIFRGSEDSRGRKLIWKCEDIKERMKSGSMDPSLVCRTVLMFFHELEADYSPRRIETGEGGRLMAPQEACNRISEVVQEAIRKMELAANDKMGRYKKVQMEVKAFDREIEEKTREAAEIKMDRQSKKMQIEELEKIVRLKTAEADMFQLKAYEAKGEAERLQRIAHAKLDKTEEDYTSSYLKQRLNEAEAEKQFLYEKIKLQDSLRASKNSAVTDP